MARDPRGRRFALLLFSTAACRSFDSQPLDPAVRADVLLERTRSTTAATPEAAQTGVDPRWFPVAGTVDLTDGLTLAEASTLALCFHPEVLEARSHARLEGIQLLQAGLLRNPELFLGPRLVEGSSDLILPASLSFPWPWNGRRQAREAAAEASIEVARQRVIATELRALAQVRQRFLALAAMDQAIALQGSLAEDADAVAAQAELRSAAGEADALTRYLARLEAQEARQELEERRLDRLSLLLELQRDVGLMPDAKLALQHDAWDWELPPLGPLDAPRRLRHPRLLAAQAAYREAEEELRLEVTRQYPDLRLGPEYESDDGVQSFGLGVGLTLPLFDRNQHAIAAAEERREARRRDYDAALLELAREEAEARAAWASTGRLMEAHESDTASLADATETAVERRFQEGVSSMVELLTARRAVARARLRSIELRHQHASAALRAALAGNLALEDARTEEAGSAGEEEDR